MTEVVLQSSPSHFPSPSRGSSSSTPCGIPNNTPQQPHPHSTGPRQERLQEGGGSNGDEGVERKESEREGDQFSVVALLVAAFRRSIVGCSIATAVGSKEFCGMEIGLPTNVRHVAHVTFDRFNGFLGLPVEFEPEVPRRAPSASATVFGVSTESMQLSYDSRGNSVPTILLMMQRQLYAQGGLQAEGIFRITAGNSQEEYAREQLNRGVIPEGIDVHCLAGLIKAWFRELPTGVLDSLSPELVMQCQTEEECAQLVRLLPATEATLLYWAINLMADVVQMENLNKMNARNIAMVFAPNMTQMSDPLSALMYAVQVMNFLKNLIVRTLREREREESSLFTAVGSLPEPSDKNESQSSSQPINEQKDEDASKENELVKGVIVKELVLKTNCRCESLLTSIENIPGGSRSFVDNCPCEVVSQGITATTEHREMSYTNKTGGASAKACKKGSQKLNKQTIVWATSPLEKGKGSCGSYKFEDGAV